MKHTQDDDPVTIDAVLEHIGGVENLEHDLPKLIVAGNTMSEKRIDGEQSGFCDNLPRDDSGERRKTIVKENCKPVEIGKRVCLPFDLHRSDHGRN